MINGKVIAIYISPQAETPMRSLSEVNAIAGLGLKGDRYLLAKGTYSSKPDVSRQVTLIEGESIEALQREQGITLQPSDVRRNLVTLGVPLNQLVGKQFRVGEAILRGIRLCDPCSHLESLTQEGVSSGLSNRGGLRAEIITGGLIRTGDIVAEM